MRTRTPALLLALLVVCSLVTAPALAQDGDGDTGPVTDLPAECLGEWTIDVDRLIAEDPEMQEMPEEQRKMTVQMIRQMLGSATVTVEKNRLVMNMMGQDQVSTFEVVKVEDGRVTLVVTDNNGQVQDGAIVIKDKDNIGIVAEEEERTLWLIRKGSDSGATVTPEPVEPKDVRIGEWRIDPARTLGVTDTEGMTDEMKAAMLKQYEQQARMLKITITDSELKMEATVGEMEETNEYEVIEVVEGPEGLEGTVIKIRMKSEDGEGEPDEGTITVLDKDHIQVDIAGDVAVLARYVETDEPEVTAEGMHAKMLGVWNIDVEATVRADESNAGKSEEELKAEIEMAKAMAGMMKFEFTADTMIIHMGENKIPQASYKVLGIEGNVVRVEITTMDGEVEEGTATIKGKRMVIDTGDGEPVHLMRADAGSDDGDDSDEGEDESEGSEEEPGSEPESTDPGSGDDGMGDD